MQNRITAPAKPGVAITRDGVALDYTLRTSARPGAPRLVLVHSLALDRSIWDGVVGALADGFDVLTYDCRGHGASDKPAGPYSTELFAHDLADLLVAVGWGRAVVGGASMGGSIALQFTISYPAMVGGLALIDTTSWYGPDAVVTWHERGQKALADGLHSLIAFQQTRWFSDTFRASQADLGDRYAQLFAHNDLTAYAATCDMLGSFDLRAYLRTIRVPVEILVGGEDFATPPDMARVLETGIADSRLTIVPGARHLTPIEIPEKVAALLQTVMTASAF